ncbi:MAG: DUF2993 domain-containing protein [Streptosporangiales bacterium]|nr:DUF2993 domain-containing protein [Streptosporangiales bacterium]MBO0889450.1 DUF2993 domain-containing protein [Acidothermales bacterium]
MRAFARVLITLVVLALVFVAADRMAVYLAEDRAEAALASWLGTRPNVEIHGFPFLTQWGQGSYREATVSGKRATISGKQIDGPVITLDDVRTSPWAHTSQDFAGATAGTVRLSGTVPFADLPLPNGVTVQRDGTSTHDVRLSGTVSVFGRHEKFQAIGTVALEHGRITLSPHSVRFLGRASSSALTSIARDHLRLSVRPPALPDGLSLTGVTVADTGIRVTATGHDLKLPRS